MTLMIPDSIPMSEPINGEIVLSRPSKLADALRMAQEDIAAGVHKGSKNEFHKYKYASAEDMIAAARESLLKHGLVASRGSWRMYDLLGHVMVEMAMHLQHAPSGERADYSIQYPVIPDKGRPLDKATNAALTTSMSYWLRDLLLIPRVDEEVCDRDDRASNGRPSLKEKLKAAEPPKAPRDADAWLHT